MPDEERRAFAERVAMQFYNAIGGEGSSDDSCGIREVKFRREENTTN